MWHKNSTDGHCWSNIADSLKKQDSEYSYSTISSYTMFCVAKQITTLDKIKEFYDWASDNASPVVKGILLERWILKLLMTKVLTYNQFITYDNADVQNGIQIETVENTIQYKTPEELIQANEWS